MWRHKDLLVIKTIHVALVWFCWPFGPSDQHIMLTPHGKKCLGDGSWESDSLSVLVRQLQSCFGNVRLSIPFSSLWVSQWDMFRVHEWNCLHIPCVFASELVDTKAAMCFLFLFDQNFPSLCSSRWDYTNVLYACISSSKYFLQISWCYVNYWLWASARYLGKLYPWNWPKRCFASLELDVSCCYSSVLVLKKSEHSMFVRFSPCSLVMDGPPSPPQHFWLPTTARVGLF